MVIGDNSVNSPYDKLRIYARSDDGHDDYFDLKGSVLFSDSTYKILSIINSNDQLSNWIDGASDLVNADSSLTGKPASWRPWKINHQIPVG